MNQPLPLHASNGYDYRTPSSSQSTGSEVPYSAGSELSMSPLQSSHGSSSASPNSLSSSYAILSQPQNQYTLNHNLSYNFPQGSASGTPLYSPGGPYVPNLLPGSIDFRSRLSLTNGATAAPPPTRGAGDPVPSSPSNTAALRNEYVTGPHGTRQPFSSTSGIYQLSQAAHPPLSAIPRSMEPALGHENSPTSAFLLAPHENALPASGEMAPPFGSTKPFVDLRDRKGHPLRPSITARIEKGFFQVHGEWVCYRRNYFTVLCTFDIGPSNTGSEPVFICRSENQLAQIRSFSLTIAAKADNEDGKSIDLVQHTPKRDKGPMTAPDRKQVKPNPGGNLSSAFHSGSISYAVGNHDYDRSSPLALDHQIVASFERMQFKKATANNGKRRAAQQYFYIIVELHGKIQSGQGPEESVKIAHQVSSKIVVRGRSPGHYQDPGRGSASQGGGAGQIGYSDNNFGHSHPMGTSLNATGGAGLPRSGVPGGQSALSRSQFLHHQYLAPSTSFLHGTSTRQLPDELMNCEAQLSVPFYGPQDFGSLPSPPTPRASQAVRKSSSSPPNNFQGSGNGYLTPLSIKEEVKISPNGDDSLRLARDSTSQPSQWRDCRHFGLQPHRDVYTGMV